MDTIFQRRINTIGSVSPGQEKGEEEVTHEYTPCFAIFYLLI